MSVHLITQEKAGVKYVSIRESYWDPVKRKYSSRTVENFGRLDELIKSSKNENILEKLQAQVASIREKDAKEKEKKLAARINEALKEKGDSTLYADNRTVILGSCVYRQIWKKLNLQRKLRDIQNATDIAFDLPGAIFYMTMARSLMPDSKLAQWTKRNQFLFNAENLKLQHLYRALDCLDKNKDVLTTYLNHQIKTLYDRKVSVVLYDVTTYYFESQNADDLRNFGYSKDCKFNQVQVVMGLLIDDKGIPIDYELYSGNTSEFGTMVPLLKKLKARYKIDKVIVTADRGLNSSENLSKIKELGMDYVIAFRLRSANKEIQEQVLDKNGWTEVTTESIAKLGIQRYKITEETRKIPVLDKKTGEVKSGKLTSNLLINYSAKRARKDAADRQRLIDKAQRYTENPALFKSDLKRGGKSYLKVDADKLAIGLDQERIKKAEAFDGYYGIVYSDSKMEAAEVMSIYHSLWQIEESFRISKSLLEARPCFHWKERRIRGHFLVCFMALVMHRLLEKELEMAGLHLSAERIVESLSEAKLQEQILGEKETYYCKSNTEGDFEAIAEAVGLGKLPSRATAAQVKRALKLKSL